MLEHFLSPDFSSRVQYRDGQAVAQSCFNIVVLTEAGEPHQLEHILIQYV